MTDAAVLPLQTFLFQFLFLLVAIALEARVLYRGMRISRRASVEYATFINLLAASLGWIVFFVIQPWIPLPIKDQLISYIFFDRLLGPNPENLALFVAATGVVIFVSAFLIKLKGLNLIEAFIQDRSNEKDSSQAKPKRPWSSLADRVEKAFLPPPINQAATILLANAYSYSAMSLLLVLRFLQIHAF